ncbi:MAG: Acylphosphatase [Candidatus Gottesmanbacteria bacterium GW2011_GWB1_43_11]|uniref:acylphosphatase n=1 Tax=Candidatus Gottesmanbacteria bacterium GW2011_GWB1_43_11 TaxID=1618446 RepID=A0A0G1CLZ2_9BACT|nr:MAG: Acylphosphatase [Candidatus Gottesmanbacteria bacterium GW2011_GWA1_42_26]KKS80896.1 MAG: Acylphosphatase [Candidatus Gottesmanbacteria bacterium GW2011_GWC1_43_10]KKS86529.1 MAG: Acylphosphatase [Candidatus Gottesmanbacteria bacterium GW2011_GWB1_43_11]OGG08747.1 MAG: hypothetical protein A2699_06550 [Candidatus Gottesmanbacteria bacterium RIFCSPHIGHO2_01_FULL_43_15]HCM38084.1 acylphosphatase [Patescibacteria group bacterium]
MKRVHIIISGDVQGVGFRAWMRGQALKLGLTGWVKNRPDKTVEAVVEGSEEKLRELIKDCHHGPDVDWVTDVQTTWGKYQNEFMTFEVRF